MERFNDDQYWLPGEAKGRPARIYLFRRWSGYSHPVRPAEPITRQELAAGDYGFCRAYVVGSGEDILMVRFEALRRIVEHVQPGIFPATMPGVPTWFLWKERGALGREVGLEDVSGPGDFVRVFRESFNSSAQIERVRNEIGVVYEYDYGGDLLKRVAITTYLPDGTTQVSEIDY